MKAPGTKRLEFADTLVAKGIISRQILQEALDTLALEGTSTRNDLVKLLIREYRIDRDLLSKEVAEYYAFKILDLATQPASDEALAFIRQQFQSMPEEMRDIAIDHLVLPFPPDPAQKDRLILITPDPTTRFVHTIARALKADKYDIQYISQTQWEEIWKKVAINKTAYDKKDPNAAWAGGEEEDLERDVYEQALEDEISRSGLTELVENVLLDGVRSGASDIHVVPKGEKLVEFHFRIDGKLILWYTQKDTRAEAVAAVVKDRAKNLDRFERSTAQDGFAQMTIDRKTIRFRVSVIPVVGKELKSRFESIVIRVLREPSMDITIGSLGFSSYTEVCLRKALAKPYGIIIVTGPTGSGKSTTLVAALRSTMDPSLNVITVEDPVEYFIDGARQVKLNPKLDFDDALRAILRHDPDIVMVGEMRDRTTADIAIKLANTGHLTFSTLHTNDAPSAIARLYKMGVEPFLIGYAINLILAQRLLRKLCVHCKKPVEIHDDVLLKKLAVTPEELKGKTIHQPVGCAQCAKGYKGRIAIHEALYFYNNIRELILRSEHFVEENILRDAAVKNGMLTLRQSALDLAMNGVTSLEEVAAVTVTDE